MATSKRPMPLLIRAKETTPPSTRTGGRLLNEIASKAAFDGDESFLVYHERDGMSYRGSYTRLRESISSLKPYSIMGAVDGDTVSPALTQAVTGTPTILTQWNTNGLSLGITVSSSTGKITVADAGIYEVDMSISFSGQLSKTFVFEIYKDDVSASPTPTATGFKMVRKLGTSGDVGSASLSGLVSLAAGDSVMIYVSSSDGGNTVTVHQSQLKVAQV